MANAIIKGSQSLRGEASAPSSKSYTHRALIAALLSDNITRISNPLDSGDTRATLNAITALGAKTSQQEDCWTILGAAQVEAPSSPIDCGESGSTLRFILPVSALAMRPSTFILQPSLARRPLAPLLKSLEQLGVRSRFQPNCRIPYVKIQGGGIKGGATTIAGDVSSQFISGLLFGCSKAESNTDINLTTPLESKDYVRMTIEILSKHGVKVFPDDNMRNFRVPSRQTYEAYDHAVPGDFSSASFLLAAAAITSSKLKVTNLNCNWPQGDSQIVKILQEAGSTVKTTDDCVEIDSMRLGTVNVDARDVPDLVPACASLACYSTGISKIYNARRLRYKESDRLSALSAELGKMGGKVTVVEDGFVVEGPCKMHGGRIDPRGDHRIAMACAVAALGAHGQTIIKNCECVNKSYPRFFEDLNILGADVTVCR
jgi:3-phosphoshikimate 1-carboxyvinyltransferase